MFPVNRNKMISANLNLHNKKTPEIHTEYSLSIFVITLTKMQIESCLVYFELSKVSCFGETDLDLVANFYYRFSPSKMLVEFFLLVYLWSQDSWLLPLYNCVMEDAEFWNESQSLWEETSLSCWTLSSTSDPSCHSSTTWCSQSVSQFSPGSLSPSISLPSAISRNSYLLPVKIKWALNKSERGKLMFFRRRSSSSLFVMLQYVCLFSKTEIDFPEAERNQHQGSVLPWC